MFSPVVPFIWLSLVSVIFCQSNVLNGQLQPCPVGSHALSRQDGQPRKCLPHQNNLCLGGLNNLEGQASAICCWHNKVDYYCCVGVEKSQCPDYQNVTVVIHKSQPHRRNGPLTFRFRGNIENEILGVPQRRLPGIGGVSTNRAERRQKHQNEFNVRHRNG